MHARDDVQVTPPSEVIRGSGVLASVAGLGRALVGYARWDVAAVMTMTLGLSVTSGVGLMMLVPFLDLAGLEVQQGGVGRIATAVEAGFDRLGLTPTVPVVIGLYLAVVSAGALLRRVHSVRTTMLYQGFVRALRREVYRAVTDARWSYFVGQKRSRFVHFLTQELERVGSAASALVALAVRGTLAAIYLGLALLVSPWTTLLVLVCGAGLAALMSHKTRLGRARGEAVSRAYEALYDTITEQLAGMRVAKAHGLEAAQLDRLTDRTEATARTSTDVVRNQAAMGFWLELGSAVIMASIFYVTLVLLGLPVASVLLLLYLFARLVPMVTGLQQSVLRLIDQLPAFARVSAFLAELREQAEPPASPDGPRTVTHALRLESVDFAHEPVGALVLRDVSLVVPAGRTTAIVGSSGAGKSTIADVAAGLVEPVRGTVRVDDRVLDASGARAWRRAVGYVDQDTFLFHDTVRENLRVVRPDAGDEELFAVLSDAAADFVADLPLGLDTVLGDRGVRLSGGERQRIALARALLARPALLVLDEATSSLDAENEKAIQRAIDRMAGSRTILLIAHRLSTVRNADRIHVVEGGTIVQSGSWSELMREPGGRFAALCRAQGISAAPAAAR